jgi:hypothetical protein
MRHLAADYGCRRVYVVGAYAATAIAKGHFSHLRLCVSIVKRMNVYMCTDLHARTCMQAYPRVRIKPGMHGIETSARERWCLRVEVHHRGALPSLCAEGYGQRREPRYLLTVPACQESESNAQLLTLSSCTRNAMTALKPEVHKDQ